MRQILIWTIVLIALNFFAPNAGAQDAAKAGFSITGNVAGISEGSSVYLTDANNPTDTLTSTRVKEGQFVLKGQLSDPNLYELNFGSAQKKTLMFIGNENMHVKGNIDDLKTLIVNGSSTEDDFNVFQQTFNPIFAHLNEVGKLYNSRESMGKMDSLARVYKLLVDSVESSEERFLHARPASYVSPFVVVVLLELSDNIVREEKRLQSLSPEVQQGYYGKVAQTQIGIAKIGAIGSDAIDFTQTDTSGRPVSLSSFKGKYVLVDFWASWCGPCRAENPNVVATYSKFRNKNFTVLGVSLDRAKDPWIKAINDDHLSWTQISDLQFWNNAVAVKYHVTQIPTNLLVDPNGKIVGKNLRGQDLTNKLCELLGCN